MRVLAQAAGRDRPRIKVLAALTVLIQPVNLAELDADLPAHVIEDGLGGVLVGAVAVQDVSAIKGGGEWIDSIEDGIKRAYAVVTIVSAEANERR